VAETFFFPFFFGGGFLVIKLFLFIFYVLFFLQFFFLFLFLFLFVLGSSMCRQKCEGCLNIFSFISFFSQIWLHSFMDGRHFSSIHHKSEEINLWSPPNVWPSHFPQDMVLTSPWIALEFPSLSFSTKSSSLFYLSSTNVKHFKKFPSLFGR
jgi:hypothetical protein